MEYLASITVMYEALLGAVGAAEERNALDIAWK
jgi:hypothetical protein